MAAQDLRPLLVVVQTEQFQVDGAGHLLGDVVEPPDRRDELLAHQHLVEAVAPGGIVPRTPIFGGNAPDGLFTVGRRQVAVAKGDQPIDARFFRESEFRPESHVPLPFLLSVKMPWRNLHVKSHV